MYLALFDLENALDTQQQALQPLCLLTGELLRRLDERCAALEDRGRFIELVRTQRCAARDEVADEIRLAEARRNFDRTGKRDDLRLDAVALQVVREDARIRRRDALALQHLWAFVRHARRQAERQAALAEVEAADLREQLRLALLENLEPPLLDDVEAHDAEVADVFLHQARNVVVAHQQHVDGHVFAVADQLILAARVAQAATHEEVERVVGQATGFLHGNLDSSICRHSHGKISIL